MKKTGLLISILLCCFSTNGKLAAADDAPKGDSIEVLSSPGLYSLTTTWAGEFNRMVPGAKVTVRKLADHQTSVTDGKIRIVSGELFPAHTESNIWKIVVGRDVIVPVINSKNPFLDEILQKGINPETLRNFMADKSKQNWGILLGNDKRAPVKYFTVNDEAVISVLKNFSHSEQVTGEIKEKSDFIASIQNDPMSIGFTRLVNITDGNNQIAENIRLLPLDRNNNGTIDLNENIYDDINIFSRGVWIGKYPRNLFSNIYIISSGKPENMKELEFLKWILTEGQAYLHEKGFSDLMVSEQKSTVERIYTAAVAPKENQAETSPILVLALVFIGLIAIFFVTESIIKFVRRKERIAAKEAALHPQLNESSLVLPKGLYFDRTHTWAFMEQNGMVKVGIDDFLQHVTGHLTRLKVKNPGEKIKKGDYIFSIIRNGKQLNLYSPVSGTIKEYNKSLDSDISALNNSPYNNGWVYRIEPSNWIREIQLLFMSGRYEEWLKNEFSRMKDFLALALSSDKEKYATVVLQDGGELIDSTLAELGPEIWEDFQTKFIDVSR